MKERINNTIKYYERETDNLVKSYDNANMSVLENFLTKHLSFTGKVVDIGCGSGRDLEFLKGKGFDIYGIDANKHFIESVQKRFPDDTENFTTAVLPELILPDTFKEFDVVMLIAVWMHIPKEHQEEAIKSIVSLMKDKSQIVFSFSIEDRENEEHRYFEKLNEHDLINLLGKYGFTCKESVLIEDGLGGRNIQWVTQIFER